MSEDKEYIQGGELAGLRARLEVFETIIGQSRDLVRQHPGKYSTSQLPPGFTHWGGSELRRALRPHVEQTDIFSRYIRAVIGAAEVTEQITNTPPEFGHIMWALQQDFGPESLRGVFLSQPDGPVHDLIRRGFEKQGGLEHQLEFLRGAYGLPTFTSLFEKTNDPFRREIRKGLMTTQGLRQTAGLDIRERKDPNASYDLLAYKEFARDWLRSLVLNATDITNPEVADALVYAASRESLTFEDLGGDIVQKIETLGVPKITAICEFSRICALADYSIAQLERMVRLAEGNEALIAYLKTRDVVAVFSNKPGDGNNILHTVPEMVDDDAERCVFFEIESPWDASEFLQKLNALGIWPSTIIFAQHGDKGQLPTVPKPEIGTKKSFRYIQSVQSLGVISLANTTEPKMEKFWAIPAGNPMQHMSQYMQPSRSIDDPEACKGVKRTIYITCDAATPAPVRDLDANYQRVEVGKASVLEQCAGAVAANTPDIVELYGATDEIKVEATQRGFHYTVYSPVERKRVPQNAVCLRVENGRITRSEVSEIILRAQAKPTT